jgi:hypothetical protein
MERERAEAHRELEKNEPRGTASLLSVNATSQERKIFLAILTGKVKKT